MVESGGKLLRTYANAGGISMRLTGAITALVTPFAKGGLDEERYRELIEWQIQEGINGLAPCGTTGESATLSHEEHESVIRICVEQTRGRVPVIAGAGSNNTKEALALARFAKRVGADALLLITPYYNKPTQEGLFAHFKAVTEEVALPAIAYNVPGRTGVNILPATMARMYKELPNIIGVKEASGDLCQISDILELCGSDFILLSGDDFTILPVLSVGGKGVISVVSNLAPRQCAELCAAYFAGDTSRARQLHYSLAPLCRACFLETNPTPVKTALSLLGKMNPEVRLPLVSLTPNNYDKLEGILAAGGYIKDKNS
jgi:4-hydroxy-tetrahydrodipicolinate synthase